MKMGSPQGYVGRREDPTETLLPVSANRRNLDTTSHDLPHLDVQSWIAEQDVLDYDPVPDSQPGQGEISPINLTQQNTATRNYSLNPLAPWFIPQTELPNARAADYDDTCSETKSSTCTSRTYCASTDWSGTTACTEYTAPDRDMTGVDS